ncbi:MAG: dihydroorotate dehydrogenase [Anaerolineae bacterium]|nr:MAG: dihydroorotate dehydrogenase [Anaerolineae bacterium]
MSEEAVVELAPNHKVGLALTNPVMPAAGCFGFGMEYGRLVEVEALGAVVVGPITAGPRPGAKPPRTLPLPSFQGGTEGVLLHPGLANPGAAAVVHRYARAWAHSPVPVIVHVAGTSPGETASCCQRLSGVEAVAGIELGLPYTITPGDATATVRAARTATSQPLIVRLPLTSADALCEAAIEAGADALTVAAPPRGTVWHAASGRFVTGRLYGRFVHPLALHALCRVAELAPVPLIGCGGIHSVEDGLAFLRAGATAIQVSGALWRDPACLARIARSLAPAVGSW